MDADKSSYVECMRCGGTFPEGELVPITIREDFGDYGSLKCPRCGAMLYDGMEFGELFAPASGIRA